MKKIKAVGWIWKMSFYDSAPYFDFMTLSDSKWGCEHAIKALYGNEKAFKSTPIKGKAVKVMIVES